MKKLYTFFMLTGLILLCSGRAMAQSVTIDDITYTLYGDSVHVTDADPFIETAEILSVVTFDGVNYPVKVIGGAFEDCSNLTSVTIPSGVIKIRESAFANCSDLASITIPSGVTVIGENAFSGCSSLISIDLPKGITSIGGSTFKKCKNLTSIDIPDNVTSIGRYAFYGCSSLTSITIPKNINTIEPHTFTFCSSLVSIDLPEGLTSIGAEAFGACSNLISVNIPKGVTSIGGWAFDRCSSLTTLTLPENVISIGDGAFRWCENLTTINIPKGVSRVESATFMDCKELSSITLPDSVKFIGSSAFRGCTHLASVNIPEGITAIHNECFSGCGITSIALPNSVVWIGKEAFYDCDNLTSVIIGDGLDSIATSAFGWCEKLSSITLPDSMKFIGEFAFELCYNLVSANIPAGVTSIGARTFASCSLTSIDLPDGLTSIGDEAFAYCDLTSIDLPNGLTSIGAGAFYSCERLASITIPRNITTIEDGTFSNCESLTSINLPDGLTSIGDEAFAHCDLTSIDLPNGLTSIGAEAFYFCDRLTSITIPRNITTIEDGTFRSCQSLTSINLPDGLTSIGDEAFAYCDLTSIDLPNGLTSIGANAFCFCDRLTSITIPRNITTIEDGTFRSCESLTSINLPEGLTSIGAEAFCSCDSLTSFDLPEGLTSIGAEAFYLCNLDSITIPRNVEKIGNDAFSANGLSAIIVENGNAVYDSRQNCNALIETYTNTLIQGCSKTIIPEGIVAISDRAFSDCEFSSIQIPNSVESIGNRAFAYCLNLRSISIPDGVTTIGENIFEGCYSLNKVFLPNTLTSIEDEAFRNCMSLTSIVIPNNVVSIGEKVFDGCQRLISVFLPASVTTIQKSAFAQCHQLARVTILSLNPVALYHNQTFDERAYESATLQVPVGSLDAYKNAQGWKRFANIVELNKYHITYTVDNEVYATDSLYEEAPISIPRIGGYTFHPIGELPSVMPANDTIINGYLTVNKYKVTYTVDGEVHHTDSVEYNKKITLPTAPTKVGYTFCGWEGLPETMPAEDVTVAGTFTINSYKITYMVDGEVHHTDSVEYNKKITLPAAPTKEGYTFSEWSEIPDSMPANDVMVVANFTINRYKITYTVDGNIYHTDSATYKSNIYAVDEPTRKGYTFGGWEGLPETMPAEDVTVAGRFTINSYKIIYMVDGEEHHVDSLLYAATINILPEPSKKGYTFGGWSEVPETMPAENVTVTGTFTINKYKVTYMVDGEEYYTDSVTYATTITPIADPTKEGYTFDGWSEMPETMPAEDITIMGTFTPDGYLITYMVDGETYRTILCNYGESIVPEAYPTKEGYSFSGWTGLPETMPAENVTVTGMFTINKYKLTYTVDGDVYHTDSITFTEAVIPIVEPEKEGYTFSGWTGVPETMPAKDVTVTGKFILNRTQTDAQGLVYELNQEGDAFEVSNYTSALVSDLVVPSDIYGVPVTTLRDRAFMGAIGLKSIVLPESVVLVGDRAFYACYDLLFVEWNAEAPIAATCFDKPDQYGNMLVYVSDASVPIAYDGNVVVNGVAEKITLTAGLPLRNTREFTARRINYTHEFTKQTRIGESGGWEALVLPFDVQTVTNEEKGALLPFGKADFTASLPYWVAELQSDGTFAYVDAIKANTPFIMEVPNSDEYEDMYNIKGNVTFSAENVVVHATTSMPEPSGSNYVLVGCYEGMESGSRVYALNDEEYTADGIEYMPGGVFVSGDRDIRPFEAYVYSNSAARTPYLRISGRNGTGLVPAVIGTTDEGWYTLQGIRLNGKPTERGVYIINRKKVIID